MKNENLETYLRSIAINADEVLRAEEDAESLQPEDDTRTAGCELLIITDPDYVDAANTLANWRIRRGIYTKVVTTTTTGSTVNQIENYIDNAYDNWTPAPSYFLFIGDAEDIPPQYVTTTPSDFYYADRQNPPDWVADFGYGRLSVDTAAQADSLVARIIRYERIPTTSASYYSNILNAACFQDGERWDGGPPHEPPDSIANRRFCKTSEDVRNYLHDWQGYPWSQREYVAYNRVSGWMPGEIFPKYWNDYSQTFNYIFENDTPGSEIPWNLQKPTFPWDGNTADISTAFNNGVFMALFRAHGSIEGWGDPDFHSGNVDALNNGEKRPLIWSITCQSGWFDGHECFAEHWIRHSTGGSVGILAATRNSYSGKNDRLIWGMMDAIWPSFLTWANDFSVPANSAIYRMGDVKNYGMDYMSTKYSIADRQETIRLFHWFGDPTTEMWTSEPNELTSAEVTSNIDVGTSSITVQVSPAIEDMLVSICSENSDSLFGTAETNSSGVATVSLNSSVSQPTELYVTITKHNYKPYEFVTGWNTWTGAFNSYWTQAKNWSFGRETNLHENAIITSDGFGPPKVDINPAYCNNLEIESGAELLILDETLYIYGDFSISGKLSMADGAGTSDILTQETFYDLHLDKTNSLYYALENGSGDDAGVDVNILNDLKLYDGSFELNNPTNLEIGNIIYIYSGAKLNANDTGTINVYVIEDWKDYNTSDGFDAGSNSVVTFHGGSPGDIHIVRENEYFNDIILNSGTSYMRPSINGDHTIYCKNMDIDNGRLKVAALKIVVDETLNITDELEMTSVDDSLYVGDINWLSSSSDIVTAGKIFVSGDWTFADGTGAELGSGNEVYFIGAPTQFITCLDSDAEFNDLIIDKSDLAAWIDDPSTDTMRVAGDMTVTAGDVFQVSEGDLLIEGILDVENGGALYLEHNGGTMTHNSDFSLNGELNINYGGDALFHGVFEVAGSGNLVIGSGNLICDAPYSKDNKVFNNIYGEINMSDGLFEITNNSLQFASGGHSITGGTIRVGYVFYANNVDVFQPSGGVVEMSSAYAGGSIVCNNLNNNYFHDLVIDDDNPLSTDITINNNLEIITGSLNTNGHDITIGGDWTNNVGDAGFVEGTGTVIFYGGNESDIITDEKFYDLSVDKNNTGWQDVEIMESNLVNVLNDLNINQGNIEMNSSSTLDIDNDLNIALGGGLNANLDTGLNIYVGGDFTNNNTYNDSWNGFWSGSSTITFDGSGNQLISSSCAADTFYNVIIDKADSLFKPTNDTEIFGDLDILNGTWDDNISGLNHNLYGDVHVSTNATWQGLGCTVLFKGDADQTYEYLNSSWYLSDVIVDKAPTKDIIIKNNTEGEDWEPPEPREPKNQTVTLLSNMLNQAAASLIIEEGTLDLNGNSAGSYGDDIIINDGGKIIVDDNAVLEVGDGNALHVNSGGILEVIGSSGNEATVTKFSVYDNYGFYVNSGGTISAEHAVFEHMNVDGIYIKDGGIIDTLNSFNNCSFSNGKIDPGSCFLKINNAQELTINAANFPDDSSVSYNVIKEEDQGVLTMLDACGDFAGEDYDYDPYNRIDWTSSYLPPVENLTIQYNTGSNEIELIWTYSTTCDSFFIYRDTDPYFTPTTKHAAVSGATTTWSETASGTKYFYIVTAYNEDAAAVMKQ